MSESDGQQQTQTEKPDAKTEENHDAEWIVDIELTLGCVNNNKVKTGSICRVPGRIREAEDKGFIYRPQIVAMGPFHRGTRSDLQIMEETKWRSMHSLLSRPTKNNLRLKTVKNCSEDIKRIGSIIRASYGEKIDMAPEELARIMLLDGCFFLELLVRLTGQNETTVPSDLDYLNDKKKMLRILADLTLLENQIPFVVLTTLSSTLFQLHKTPQHQQPDQLSSLQALCRQVNDEVKELSPKELAESLFKCNFDNVDFSKGVFHFLHLIHLCSPDPYQKEEQGKDPLQLQRCARMLQAFGITIKASQPNDSQGNEKPGTVASVLRKFLHLIHLCTLKAFGIPTRASQTDDYKEETAASVLWEFVDKFEFKIEFNEEKRELIIPTLHMKKTTEVNWRNLIAFEQLGLNGIGYKFTSYAYFFKGLVCSVHDLKLLNDKGVIRVDKEVIKDEDLVTNKEVIKDEDLVKMFQSITTGEEQMDGRYMSECKKLNEAEVNGCCVILRMPEHYLWRFLEWLRRRIVIIWLRKLLRIYLGTPWRILGFVSGAIALALTILQAVYTVRRQ